jgi:nucleolar protein 6
MSRMKDSRSKKRKLADVNQSDFSPPPKARIIQSDPKYPTPERVLVPTSTSGQTLNGGEVETGSQGQIEGKQQGKRNGSRDHTPDAETAERPVEEWDTTENAQQKGIAKVSSRMKSKDKASARQAKSEQRSKKRKNLEGKETLPATIVAPTDPQSAAITDFPISEQTTSAHISNVKPEPSKQRFILFIGNLPYTTTTSAIQSHFSKLLPFTVRHSTDKSTGRSRGFAFLEFEAYDKMKTCLKLYHHSLFDPVDEDEAGEGKEKRRKNQARKINVELTAGGGGVKSEARKEMIRGKNEKLESERERRRVHREKEEAAANKKRKDGGKKTGANAVEITNGGQDEAGDANIHPSRRKRMRT